MLFFLYRDRKQSIHSESKRNSKKKQKVSERGRKGHTGREEEKWRQRKRDTNK